MENKSQELPFQFHADLEVRFRDVDGMGHVNNAVYLTYFEIARTGYMIRLGGYQSIEEFNFIVARTECNYRHGARVAEWLRVDCGVARLGNSSFTMHYRITTDEGRRLIADGVTVQAWYDFKARRVIPCPDLMRDRMAAFDAQLLALT